MTDAIGNVFVSHKTSDAAIGKVVANFVRDESGNRVKVFFSSDPKFVTPRGGRALDDELTEAIGESGVVILIYTGMTDHVDWAYCIYEAAYAKSKGIPVYIFQCHDDAPAPLRHLVRFNVSNEEDIRKFVIDFLTSANFFPSQKQKVTDFSPQDQAVEKKAQELFQKLDAEVKKLSQGAKEWTPWPYLRVQVDGIAAAKIVDENKPLEERASITDECLSNTAIVVDKKAIDSIFGIGVRKNEIFSRLLSSWKESCSEESFDWYHALVDQVTACANRSFHSLRDEGIREAMGKTYRLPVVTRTLAYPDESIEFEILFFKMTPRGSLVKDAMIERENMYLKILNEDFGNSSSIKEVFEEMRVQNRHRLPVLDSTGRIVYMIHRSMISEFVTQSVMEGKSLEKLTFQDMLSHPEMKNIFETTFVFAGPDTTLGEARQLLKEQASVRDIFVTQSGHSDEPILGMLTATDVVEQEAPPQKAPETNRTAKPIRDGDFAPELVVLPQGEFLMGSPDNDQEAEDAEKPQHRVRIDYRVAMGRYPVTFEEYDHFCERTGRVQPEDQGWGRGRWPVINVAWEDATAYCQWLSGVTGQSYRLPSEAEWEYACRASTTTRYAFGDEITTEQANFGGKVGKTVEVGSYSANTWGLCDMHGNVWEWLEDCWNETYEGAPDDGSAWTSGDCIRQVVRGGSWGYVPGFLRSACRSKSFSHNRFGTGGFRVARTLP